MKEQNLYIVVGVVLVMLLYIVSARRSVCEDFTDDPGLMKQISDGEAAIKRLETNPPPSEVGDVGRKAYADLVLKAEAAVTALKKQRDDARAAGAVAESKAVVEAKAATLAKKAVPISSTSTEVPSTYSSTPMSSTSTEVPSTYSPTPMSSIEISKLIGMATDFTPPSTIPMSMTPTPTPQEDTLSSVTSVLGSGLSLGALIGIIVAVLAVGIIALVSVLNITGLSSFFPKDSLPLSPIPPPPSF
jgi:hypothetical protein